MFAHLFQQSIDSGEIPKEWSLANICPLYKKGDRSSACNYRPVSLTCGGGGGWSGGAMVLGKLPVPGRPTNLNYSRARAYCTCSKCGWGLFGHFSLIYHFSFLSPSLWETARYRLKYCLKGPLSPNNQPTSNLHTMQITLTYCLLKCYGTLG